MLETRPPMSPPERYTPSSDALDLRALLGILRRQARLIVGATGVVLGLGLLYVLTAKPLYQAEALILVDPLQRNLLDPTPQQAASGVVLNARVESEAEILRSHAMALAVVQAHTLILDPEFGPSLSTMDKLLMAIGIDPSQTKTGDALVRDVVDRFRGATDIERRSLTYLIGARMTSEDPTRAATLANALAETYITQQLAAKIEGALAARDLLQGQMSTAENRLATTEGRLDTFIFDNLDRLEAESGDPALAQLRASLSAQEVARSTHATLASALEGALATQNWAQVSEDLGDAALRRLSDERKALRLRLSRLEAGSKLELDLRAEFEALDAALNQRGAARLSSLRADLADAEEGVAKVKEDIRTALFQSDLSPATLAEIYSLQQAADLSRQQVQTLLSRLADLEAQAAVQVADSRIVSPALPPSYAAFPNASLILLMALFVGVGLGTGLAFANEYMIGGVTSDAQLQNLTSLDVAANVPIQSTTTDERSLADLIVEAPLSEYAEAFRQLRASIDQTPLHAPRVTKSATSTKRARVVLVTSALPMEGKSTTALALARTYAASGQRTVVIDGDLRKPSLAKQLGAAPTSGLLDFLASERMDASDVSFYVKDPLSPLKAFVGGRRSRIPTDQLLVSDRFEALLTHARAASDVVIVDSPPLVPVVDARYIVSRADTVVLVARYASTRQSDVRYAMDQIRGAARNETTIVSVLNYEERGRQSYRYRGYYQDQMIDA